MLCLLLIGTFKMHLLQFLGSSTLFPALISLGAIRPAASQLFLEVPSPLTTCHLLRGPTAHILPPRTTTYLKTPQLMQLFPASLLTNPLPPSALSLIPPPVSSQPSSSFGYSFTLPASYLDLLKILQRNTGCFRVEFLRFVSLFPVNRICIYYPPSNPSSTLLPSESFDTLLCDLIALAPCLALHHLMTRALAAVKLFSSDRTNPFLISQPRLS